MELKPETVWWKEEPRIYDLGNDPQTIQRKHLMFGENTACIPVWKRAGFRYRTLAYHKHYIRTAAGEWEDYGADYRPNPSPIPNGNGITND